MRFVPFSQQLLKVFHTVCEQAGSKLSNEAWRLASTPSPENYRGLLAMRAKPADYVCPEAFFKDNVVCEFFRKVDIYIPGVDKKADAKEKFIENESCNYRTNQRLFPLIREQRCLTASDVKVLNFLGSVRREIRRILGVIPEDLFDGARFGKGSTYADKGVLATLPDKMSSRPTVTREAICFLPLIERSAWYRAIVSELPFWSHPQIVPGNRFESVPKTALKNRGMAIEPSINIFLQLGVGSYMKDRLERDGLDMREGSQERNRDLARLASKTGHLATVDLSDASDLISRSLIEGTWPSDWLQLLQSLRSECTEVDGRTYRLEKFSSMGNGFTFEMLTVTLYAICKVLCESRNLNVSQQNLVVYGDDIICPVVIVKDLRSCLSFLGMKVNEDKTFSTGLFRESCGGDFFNGVSVRAHNVKEDPSEPQHWIALANALRAKTGFHRDDVNRGGYRVSWFRALDALPSDIRRMRGPEELGDLVVHDDDDRWQYRRKPNTPANHCYRETPDCRKFVRAYVPVYSRLHLSRWKPGVVLACALYGVPSNGIVPRKGGRDQVEGYTKRWVALGR